MFLLVPAHPGCPGQNPKSHKMVVCVCVCVNYVITYSFTENLDVNEQCQQLTETAEKLSRYKETYIHIHTTVLWLF